MKQIALISPLILSAALAAPTPQTTTDGTSISQPDASGYHCFRGLDFPQSKDWRSFRELQDISHATLSIGNSPETVSQILDEIKSVANEAGIDP